MSDHAFRTDVGRNTFNNKYAGAPGESWPERCHIVVDDVCGTRGGTTHPLMCKDDRDQLTQYMIDMWFMPGGRYLYYAGRAASFWNNCYLFKAIEDTREEWSRLIGAHMSALMTGGGIGTDYSVLRRAGAALKRTGGLSSGPLPLMHATNETGRNVMQGGSRRSAIYASLARIHADIWEFMHAKNWHEMPVGKGGLTLADVKEQDFNYPAPLDMTNISVNYDDDWLKLKDRHLDPVYIENVKQALRTGEPGFSFNFGPNAAETLRNACTEVCSEDDSDVCNLGSINMGPIPDVAAFKDVSHLASKFLICGTLRSELPNESIRATREKNRRIGVGLMGMHEWLLRRGKQYMVTPEMHDWLKVYKSETEKAANEHCDRFFISRPVKYRAVAPTGTIGMVAGTTTGIEPLYATAFKRRYLVGGDRWKYEFVVDATADYLIRECGAKPETIDTAMSLAADPGARITFQAQVQRYVDHAISSTINLPAWGSELNNEDRVEGFAKLLADNAPHIRGFTCYPDGARGGQPLTAVPYDEAVKKRGVVYDEVDVCEMTGHGGVCGA